jgi:hypothetical protein
MSLNSTIFELLNQYTGQYTKQIGDLEGENTSLKDQLERLNHQFSNLSQQHTEIKQVYTEAERENELLKNQLRQLTSDDIAAPIISEPISTSTPEPGRETPPPRPATEIQPPNQKRLHRNSKRRVNMHRYKNDSEPDQDNTNPNPESLVDDRGHYIYKIHPYHSGGKLCRRAINAKINGEYKKFNHHGQLINVCNYSNGIKNGEEKLYYDNGKLSETTMWVNGKLHGECIRYWSNGVTKEVCNYLNGIKVGGQGQSLPN